MTNVNKYIPVIAILLSALLCGCGKQPNVLILTLDTTRADRLGCYGYEKANTPNLDRLAAEGVLFENAQAVMPITLPTHTTIFTGYLPIEHGLRISREYSLPDDIPTMAEIFKAAGYQTAAFIASPVLDAKYGLNRGFDYYDWDSEGGDLSNMRLTMQRSGHEITDSALAWFKDKFTGRRKPFMIWAHYFDPHMPRIDHPELRRSAGQDPYDIELAFMDQQIGRLFKYLEDIGELDNTLVMAVADHGESLGEHNELFHGYFIYQSTQHIPLLFRWPGKIPSGVRVKGTVSQTDLMPTICDLAGVDRNSLKTGRKPPAASNSLFSVIKGEESLRDRMCHMESLWPYHYFGWAPLSGIVEGEWSYIHAPEKELYNLVQDPGETNNLAKADKRRSDEMELELEKLVSSTELSTPGKVSVTSAEVKRFASLGYLSGKRDTLESVQDEDDLMSLPNPKDKSRLVLAHNRQSMLGTLYNDDEVLEDCLLLVYEFPDKPRYMLQAGRAYMARNQIDEALKMFEQAESVSPSNTVVLTCLAQTYSRKQRYGDMLGAFKKASEVHPDDKKLKRNFDDAVIFLKQLLERDPSNAAALSALKGLE